jgi:polysaccharide export outer membrane protein
MGFRALGFSFIGALVVSSCLTISAKDIREMPVGGTFDGNGDYVIGNSDEIGVRVQGDNNINGSFGVGSNGYVSIPIVGPLRAQGMTSKDFLAQLEQALIPYVKDPTSSVWVASRRSYKAYFVGEITRTGVLSFEEKVSLLQGIALAGGLTPYATGRIVVVRPSADGTPERYAVTYKQLLHGGVYDKIIIERGDTVIVE